MKRAQAAAIAVLTAALTACAPSSSVLRTLDAYRQLNAAKAEYPVSREAIDGQPYAVLGAQVEGGLKGLLALREQQGGVDIWRADNGVLVATRNGRVLRTIGFPQDQRDAAVLSGSDPLGQPMDPALSYRFVSRLDLAPDRYGLTAEHELSYVANEELSLHHKPRTLAHWHERVHVRELGKTWKQEMWVDAQTGEVWRSVQQIGEKTSLTLEVLKAAPLPAGS